MHAGRRHADDVAEDPGFGTRSPTPSRARTPARAAAALAALTALAAVTGPAAAQSLSPTPDSAALAALSFRSVGPASMGGRVADFAVDPADVSTFYVGFATGGVWKTTNHGARFVPVFDGEDNASIGDVTVAPSNPNVVWVGTGEPQNRQSSPWGNGVYRSVDGGATWTHVGLEATRHIGRIVVHPEDPDVAWVAAVGHLWGPNPERGVYRTTDGGETWEKVLFVSDNTGIVDLALDPDDPKTLYAAAYQRRRTSFGFNGGGPEGGLYRTHDGGESWEKLAGGLPEGDVGRIGVDVYDGDGDIVYAVVEAEEGEGVYRSVDRGASWEKRSDTNPRPMYYSQIRVDPNDPERVYLGGTSFYVSEDGGRSFESERPDGVHVDHHALWIDPGDSDHLLLGNDGGVYVSWDRGESWRMYDNMAVGQYYEIGLDTSDPYRICGGLQDNGTWCGPSANYSGQGILNAHWREVNGGDGFYAELDPGDPTILFAEFQNGNLIRIDLDAGEGAWITPLLRPGQGEAAAEAAEGEPEEPTPPTAGMPSEQEEEEEEGDEEELRWNWNSPILMSSHDPSVVYYGANILYRSPDRGHSWEAVSPDLTKAIDRDELEIMGVSGDEDMLSKHDGISSYGNMTTLSESPLDADVLYAGTDDGNLQVTRDGGETWTNVVGNVPGLPERTYVSRVVASSHRAGTVYATFDGHVNDDYAAYVYRSDDYGASWRRITDGLPASSVNVLAEHPDAEGLLFVGNERGAWFSLDRGAAWTELEAGLPTVPVDDIEIHPRENDLVLGTHGRSLWVMDDVAPLVQMARGEVTGPVHLFPVRPATSFSPTSGEPEPAGDWAGENPPYGAMIRYWLASDLEGEAEEVEGDGSGEGSAAADDGDVPGVQLEILGPDGESVRSLEGPGTAGSHQVVWDLRVDRPYETEESQGFFGSPRGYEVLPGTYAARLVAAGDTLETEVVVEGDPRVDASRADLEARQRALEQLYVLGRPFHDAEQALEDLEGQLEDVRDLVEDREDAPEELETDLSSAEEELEAVSELLDEVSGDAQRLYFLLQASSTPPTEDQAWQLDRVWEEAPGLLERVNALTGETVPGLFGSVYAADLRPETAEPVDVPARPGG